MAVENERVGTTEGELIWMGYWLLLPGVAKLSERDVPVLIGCANAVPVT